jgi:hypothetical protein
MVGVSLEGIEENAGRVAASTGSESPAFGSARVKSPCYFAAMKLRTFLPASLALSSLACSGSRPDLPAGWEDAQAVTNFTQAACGGSVGPGSPSESIDVDAGQGSVNVEYHNANFRCDQAVEGFLRMSPKSVDFLVQPTDMNPSSVAGCDCLYEITLAASVPEGPTTVTVYRRWDEKSGNTNPVEVGTANVTVR